MKILISGSSGLIGSALVRSLEGQGHEVMRLVRAQSRGGEHAVRWDPAGGRLDRVLLEGVGAVIHLAGENVAAARWTTERKLLIRDSRVKSTELLASTIARLAKPPRTFLCASAVGIYGDRGDEVLREDSPPGTGFLADVCRVWEAATEPARNHGVRVANLRFGIVLSASGGALVKMLPPFKAGVGGVIGSGRQYMSWITLDDAVGAIRHTLETERLAGPVNVVAPNPVTNREFTRTLGRVLGRPTLFPVPAFALKMALGEMAQELLASQRAEPAKLLASGYTFLYPELEAALRHVLGASARRATGAAAAGGKS